MHHPVSDRVQDTFFYSFIVFLVPRRSIAGGTEFNISQNGGVIRCVQSILIFDHSILLDLKFGTQREDVIDGEQMSACMVLHGKAQGFLMGGEIGIGRFGTMKTTACIFDGIAVNGTARIFFPCNIKQMLDAVLLVNIKNTFRYGCVHITKGEYGTIVLGAKAVHQPGDLHGVFGADLAMVVKGHAPNADLPLNRFRFRASHPPKMRIANGKYDPVLSNNRPCNCFGNVRRVFQIFKPFGKQFDGVFDCHGDKVVCLEPFGTDETVVTAQLLEQCALIPSVRGFLKAQNIGRIGLIDAV